MSLNAEEMGQIFRQTVIVRQPTHGIVTGYHELPYVCLGESIDSKGRTTQVSGKVRVSPRFLIRPPQYEPRYEEIFGEDNVDMALLGRVFGFMGFHDKPVECKSEFLEVKHLQMSIDSALSQPLDALERKEDITTGVFIPPDARYYPVSIERFISSVLEQEFGD